MNNGYLSILKNSTVLLAEDEVSLRESFKRVLEFYVGKVVEANDGLEALEIFKNEKINIIFSDVKMPRLNGIDFVKQIRKLDKKVPIIITSAYGDQDYLLECIKLSLVEYLIKPVKEKDLLRVLSVSASELKQNYDDKITLSSNGVYDFTNKKYLYKNETIDLTNKEVQFLELLLANKNNLVTKARIQSELYIYNEAPPSALKNLVFKLRKKLIDEIISTISQHGYMIKLP